MKGYHIKLKGLNLDNTLEKINKKNIILYELKRTSHQELDFKVKTTDFKIVKPLIAEFEQNISALGFNRFRKVIASNIAIIFALPICLILFYLSSNLIWKINITGVDNGKKTQILEILKDNGVSISNKKNMSATEIENLLIENDYIAQVSCYYKGSTLFVNISEKLVYEEKEYLPIVAQYNGIILDCTITRGTINFVLGEYVTKGDVLVYPYIVDKEGNQIPVEPMAEIQAKCFITETSIIPRTENVLIRTGKTKTYYNITFGKKKNPAKNRKPFVFYETIVYNDYISSVLPFNRQKTVYYELALQKRTNDLENLTTENEQYVKSLLDNSTPKGVEIIEEKVTSMIIDDSLYSTAYLTCITNIN